VRAAVLFLLILLTRSAAAHDLELLPEERVVTSSPANLPRVTALRRELALWREKKPGPQLLLFAELGGPYRSSPGEIIRVVTPNAWPENTATGYAIVIDEQRRIRLFQESPTSFSGDWRLELTHVFDEAGRTVSFARFSQFYNSGCSKFAREQSVAFYDREGRLLARDYRLEDDTKRPLKASDCAFFYRYKYRIHSDARSVLEAAHLSAGVARAGAKLAP